MIEDAVAEATGKVQLFYLYIQSLLNSDLGKECVLIKVRWVGGVMRGQVGFVRGGCYCS